MLVGDKCVLALLDALCVFVFPHPTKGLVKQLYIRTSNLGFIEAWLKEFKLEVRQDLMNILNEEQHLAVQSYVAFKKEAAKYVKLMCTRYPVYLKQILLTFSRMEPRTLEPITQLF